MKKSLITSFVFISLVYAPVDVFAESPFGQEPQDPVYAAEPGGGTLSDTRSQEEDNNTPTPTDAGGTQNSATGAGAQGNGLMPVSQNNGGVQPAGVGQTATGGSNLWQYLLSLIGAGGVNGQNNQSPFKNQENKVTPSIEQTPVLFNSQYTAPTPVKTGSTSTAFSCKFNASKTSLGVFLSIATCFVFALIPIMIALLLLWFIFGSIKYINDSEHENRGQYKTFLVWGVIILFVALSFVGILRVMSKTLGI
jgi:hypothetical protein